EALHRLTDHPQGGGTLNDKSFRVRIEELLGRVSHEMLKMLLGDAELFESTLRQTRNYFTHVGLPEKKHVLTDAGQIFLFNQKLHALLRLLLLIQIGFSESEVSGPIHAQANLWT